VFAIVYGAAAFERDLVVAFFCVDVLIVSSSCHKVPQTVGSSFYCRKSVTVLLPRHNCSSQQRHNLPKSAFVLFFFVHAALCMPVSICQTENYRNDASLPLP